MTEGGGQRNIIHNFHIDTLQDDDTRAENKTKTDVIDSLPNNYMQQDPNNDAAENPNNEEADEISEGVSETTMSPSAMTSVRSKVSSNQGERVFTETKNNENRDGKQNPLPCELLKEQALALYNKGKYLPAASILEKLFQYEDIGVFVLYAEVSIQLLRKQEAKKAIDDVVRIPMASPSEVVDIFYRNASDSVVNSSYVRAIVFLRISSDMYRPNPSLSPDEIVGGICKCVGKMEDAVASMIESDDRSKLIALNYGLSYMVEMVDDLRRVENSDPIRVTFCEAACVLMIGSLYNMAKEHEKSIEFCESGLDVMKRQLGNNASKYKIYGCLLLGFGSANHYLARDSIAEDYYKRAIDVFNNATDFRNKDEKLIKCAQDNLKNLCKFMK